MVSMRALLQSRSRILIKDPSQAILELFNVRLGLSVSDQDLAKVHYLPTKDKDKGRKPVLVKFVNRRTRDSVLQARKNLKSLSDAANRVYINEHLTHHNAVLFAEARRLFKKKLIHSTWTRECKTYIKLSDSSPERPRRVTSLKDLALS